MRKSNISLMLALASHMTAPTDAIAGVELGGTGTAPVTTEGVEPAGVINEVEAVTLPDTTEGNRGPSSTTRNNGDPTMPITTPVPEDLSNTEDMVPTIGNSTNAVTEHARKYLTPMQEVSLQISRPVNKGYEVKPAFVEALGTDNVEPGAFNSAFRSIVFRYPEGHGQRAAILYKDGIVKFLASGTNYSDWYAMTRSDDVACAAIIYFNQNESADNPYVSVRWYKKDELPEVVVDGNDEL